MCGSDRLLEPRVGINYLLYRTVLLFLFLQVVMETIFDLVEHTFHYFYDFF